MFSKLLKYDNRAVFKYWWMAAVGSLIVAALGGICLNVAVNINPMHEFIETLAILGTTFSVFGMMLLPLISMILILIRYYKNFFTDEGYLTFTLPVKKSTLLNSKLTMAMIFTFASTLVTILSIFILLAIGIPDKFFSAGVWSAIGQFFGGYFETFGGYGVVFIILALLIIVALTAAQMLFIFFCITIAATITKKHKILAAIGIYYGANMVLTIAIEILLFGGMFSVFGMISALEYGAVLLCVTFIMVGILGAIIATGAGLYLIQLNMLDKKLNLE